MAVTELDSFVTKFKSLWASGQKAKLTIDSRNGNVWLNLQVGLRCPEPQHDVVGDPGHHQSHGKSNARQRRRIRRSAARSHTATEDVAVTAGVVENTTKADASVPEVVSEDTLATIEKEKEDLEEINKFLKQKVKDLEEECETVYHTKAVDNMLYEDFKERMKEKYEYSSNDTESDYESDEETRERNREKSRENKRLKKSVKNKCDKCDFTGKTEAGLKSHKTKKHKE